MFAKTVETAEGSICENCIQREFTSLFTCTHADAVFGLDKLPDYRKYRAENQKVIKAFCETETYFDTFHVDDKNNLLIIQDGYLDKAMMHSDPMGTRYDAIRLDDIIHMDYLYNYIDLDRKVFQDLLLCDIYVLIVAKNDWYPYLYYAPVAENVKLQVTVNEDAYEEIMENEEDLNDGVFRITEKGEFLAFREFMEAHMSKEYREFQEAFRDPEISEMPEKYGEAIEYFFNRIHLMKKLGVFDKDYYYRFLDKNIANKKLRKEMKDKYW